MTPLHLVGFLALLLVHPASSRVAALHRTEQTLALRETSGMVSGEEEGSGLENPNNSVTSPENVTHNRGVKVGHRDRQVARMGNDRGVKRFLNLRPRQDESSGMDLHKAAPKMLSHPRVSNMQEHSLNPAMNIEVDPASEKPLRKAIVGSTNRSNTTVVSANLGTTSHAVEQATVKQLDPFEMDCLETHNSYRAKHGVPPLMWSAELAESAQTWADHMASNNVMKHDQVAMTTGKLGENLAYFTPPIAKCERAVINNCVMCREMVQRWYNEIKNYDFDKGQSRSPKTPYKHFSQIVWANTAEMGVGTAVSNKFGFITVARYRPMGNEGGTEDFIKNVPPEGGPLPIVTSSFGDALPNQNITAPPPSEPVKQEHSSPVAVTLESVVKSGAPSAATPDTAQTQVTSPSGSLTDRKANVEGSKSGGSKTASHRNGFVHTVTAADGSQAQVYLSKSGDHAGIVFRDQISRAYPTAESVHRTIQVL